VETKRCSVLQAFEGNLGREVCAWRFSQGDEIDLVICVRIYYYYYGSVSILNRT
jgi:hypothetical protein